MEEKQCNVCKEIKPINQFNKGSHVKKDGSKTHSYNCKECLKKYREKYYAKNRELSIAKANEWRKNNYEQSLQNTRNSYFRHREINLNRRKEQRNNEDPILLSEKRKKWYRNNPEPKLIAGKKWRENNREYMNEKQREWAKRNRDSRAAKQAERRAAKLQRTPKWLTKEDKQAIKEFYTKAKQITIETKIRHVVDHIIPLQGKLVSGLHVPWNLQILTESENSQKSNKCPCWDVKTEL